MADLRPSLWQSLLDLPPSLPRTPVQLISLRLVALPRNPFCRLLQACNRRQARRRAFKYHLKASHLTLNCWTRNRLPLWSAVARKVPRLVATRLSVVLPANHQSLQAKARARRWLPPKVWLSELNHSTASRRALVAEVPKATNCFP